MKRHTTLLRFRAVMQAGLALGSFGLAACSTAPIGGAPGLQVLPGDLPAPRPTDLYAKADFAGVRPFDTLTIDVFGIEELSKRTVRVDANWRNRLPAGGYGAGRRTDDLGNLAASGRTSQIAIWCATRR